MITFKTLFLKSIQNRWTVLTSGLILLGGITFKTGFDSQSKTTERHWDKAALNRSSFINHPDLSVSTTQTFGSMAASKLFIQQAVRTRLHILWWNQGWRWDETEGKCLDWAGWKPKTAKSISTCGFIIQWFSSGLLSRCLRQYSREY